MHIGRKLSHIAVEKDTLETAEPETRQRSPVATPHVVDSSPGLRFLTLAMTRAGILQEPTLQTGTALSTATFLLRFEI